MAHLKCICTLIAILLAFVQRSNAVITDTTCTPGSVGTKTCADLDANAECPASTTKCACKANYFFSSGKSKCEQDITTVGCTPGDDSTGTAACKKVDANSECKTGSKCSCKEGYKGTDSCIKDITTVGCTTGTAGTTKCKQFDANSECKTGGKCACKVEYKGTDSCTKVIGGTCAHDVDCTGSVANSECSTQKCKCKDNFIEESAICKKALGQACTKKEDCVSNAECDNKECKCSTGFTKTIGLCAAESSATSVWLTTSLLVTSLLTFLPRFICC